MPSGHVRSHSGDAVLKKNPSRLPVCIVAQFMHGGEADSRAIVQSTTHDYNGKPMALSILLRTEGIPTIRSFRGSTSSES